MLYHSVLQRMALVCNCFARGRISARLFPSARFETIFGVATTSPSVESYDRTLRGFARDWYQLIRQLQLPKRGVSRGKRNTEQNCPRCELSNENRRHLTDPTDPLWRITAWLEAVAPTSGAAAVDSLMLTTVIHCQPLRKQKFGGRA
jgi:hypothetical protein